MNAVLQLKDITNKYDKEEKWLCIINKIIQKGQNCNKIADVAELLDDHDPFRFTTSDYVLAFVAGFVANKARRFSNYIYKKNLLLVMTAIRVSFSISTQMYLKLIN